MPNIKQGQDSINTKSEILNPIEKGQITKEIEFQEVVNDFTESDFEGKSTKEILELIESQMTKLSYKESLQRLNILKTLVDENLEKDKNQALESYTMEGNNAEDLQFEVPKEFIKFNNLLSTIQQLRIEEKKRIEEEKETNYNKKLEILQKLSGIIENDETEKTIREVKELQLSWKAIKVLPKDKIEDLWNRYHRLLDTFYDKHSINIELKELDRQKNLEFKIELSKKVLSLHEEPNIKRSFILLNKYHEDYKNTGPVPREYNEEIWQRFKAASDEVYQNKKMKISEMEAQKEDNLEKKKILTDKAILVAKQTYERVDHWKLKQEELKALMEEWKKIGPVPKKQSNKIWAEFKNQFDEFYHNRNEFYSQVKEQKKVNLSKKLEICEKAEIISKELNFKTGEANLKSLQEQWKQIGPVPKKDAEQIWNKFRSSCDSFFEARKSYFKERRLEEKDNLIKKNNILDQLSLCLSQESSDELLKKLKTLQSQWVQIGHVSYKQKDAVNNKYNELSTKIFEKFKGLKNEIRTNQKKQHFSNLLGMPNGAKQLSFEESKLRKRIESLKSEVHTLENNKQFFARSKNADDIFKDFDKKIEKSQILIKNLSKELQLIRQVKNTRVDQT
tara:strand:+ start:1156 stop:3012 length:1857 start_codon:yes stop_codon:yes gene_type:complete